MTRRLTSLEIACPNGHAPAGTCNGEGGVGGLCQARINAAAAATRATNLVARNARALKRFDARLQCPAGFSCVHEPKCPGCA